MVYILINDITALKVIVGSSVVEVVVEGALCVFCLDGGPSLSVPLSLPRPANWQLRSLQPAVVGWVQVPELDKTQGSLLN